MKDGVEMAMKKQGSEKVHGLLGFIDRMIERVAQMTDEAAQSDFVKSFLNFAAKFHSYSFGNQMLIWVQKPTATYVRGFKQWMEMGREVANWDGGIAIIAPMFKKMEYTPEQLAGKSQDQIDKMPQMRTYFQAVKVYDVSDTKPIEGWQKLKGKAPFEPPKLKTDVNENVEEITVLINATTDWAKEKSIDVDVEAMDEHTGGYSSGGKIRINDASKGINYFSTLVHECAHEMLHWIEENGKKSMTKVKEDRQKKEIDAETTSFIVLRHYGFEYKDAPNYLALWKAKGEDIKERRENIRKAVELIVDGIDSKVKQNQLTEASLKSIKKVGFITNYIPNISSF
jgi:antirestriction protein ArdC